MLKYSWALHGDKVIRKNFLWCSVEDCAYCLLTAQCLTLIQSSAPIQTLSLRTGTSGEGGREEEDMKGGRKGGLSHYLLGATHSLCVHFIPSSLFPFSNSNVLYPALIQCFPHFNCFNLCFFSCACSSRAGNVSVGNWQLVGQSNILVQT